MYKFTFPDEWNDGRVLLNFEAVDYAAEVWVNEQAVGRHKGGYTPFSFDITNAIKEGVNIQSYH